MESEQNVLRFSEQEPRNSPYVLTWDIDVLMKKLCSFKGWVAPSDESFRQSRLLLEQQLNNCFPGNPLLSLDFTAINQGIEDIARVAKNELQVPIVTLDAVYGEGITDYLIQPTRVINQAGCVIGEGSRPGTPALEQQISNLKTLLGNQSKVLLLDVGAFSGGSLISLRKLMGTAQIDVMGVILGIATEEAKTNLVNNGFVFRSVEYVGKPVDWLEARDFIPFTPLCGRVVDAPEQTTISQAIPYVLPQGNPIEWASIPSDKATELSLTCWNISAGLFKEIEVQNNLQLTLADLAASPIRVSYPGYDQDCAPNTKLQDIISSQISLII